MNVHIPHGLFHRVKFAAATLACAVPLLVGGPAMAQSTKAAPLNLTPYRLMSSSSGLCMTVYPDPQTNNLYGTACGSTSGGDQIFYILDLTSDTDFVPQTQAIPPGQLARIARAKTFDSPTNPTYNELRVGASFLAISPLPAPIPAPLNYQWLISKRAASQAWVTVASQNQSFGVAGPRSLQYGANGQYVYKNVEGDLINGIAQCTTVFFGSDPAPGVPKFCAVLNAAPESPFFVYIQSPFNGECVTQLTLGTSMDTAPCTYLAAQMWTLVPAPYPVN